MSIMTEYNKRCLDKSNLNQYLKEVKGEGVTVVVFDGGNYPNGYDYLDFEAPHLAYKHVDSVHAGKVLAVGKTIVPNCKVIMFRYYDQDGYDWVLKNKDKVDAVNISMGIAESDSVFKNMFKLKEAGVPVFVSAGNDGSEEKLTVPKSLDFVITVGAANHTDDTVYYSNRGDNLDILGYTNIEVKHKDGDIVRFTGTSCASPFACFSTALMISLLKKKGKKIPNPEAIRKILHKNATDIRDVGFDKASGYGIIRLPEINYLLTITEDINIKPPVVEKPTDVTPPVSKPTDDINANKMNFKDVPTTAWCYDVVKYVYDEGLMSGMSKDIFSPNGNLTRAEMAVILKRLMEKK